MAKTMDTKTPHPDDVARMPNSTASTPTGFLNDLLECLNYGRKSLGIAGEWKRVCGNCIHFITVGPVFAKQCRSCYFATCWPLQ